jgi:hypothetical protein
MRLLDTHFGGGGGKLRMLVITAPEAARMLSAAFGREIAPPRMGYEIPLPKGPRGEEPMIENVSGELRYRPDSRAFTGYFTGYMTMTSDVIEYLRAHPDFAKKQCRPEELVWIETHLPPRYDGNYRWQEYADQHARALADRRSNPGERDGSLSRGAAVGLGVGALAVVGGFAYWLTRPSAATVAPGGTPMVQVGGARQAGDTVAMPAFTAYYEETHTTGDAAPAQNVLLIREASTKRGRWFVHLGRGGNAWADIPA